VPSAGTADRTAQGTVDDALLRWIKLGDVLLQAGNSFETRCGARKRSCRTRPQWRSCALSF